MKQKLIHQFYESYYKRLLAFAFALLRSQENAEEAVQNVFRKLSSSSSLEEIKKPYPYLIQCTKYEAYALLAKERKVKEVNYQFLKAESERNDQADCFSKKLEQVRKAINKLPPKCKEIMLLKVNEGLTHAEISDYLKVSSKTIEKQVSIAVKKIKKNLQNV